MFEIRHHGAVNGVTGSCHELQIDAANSVLVDCGLFQGAETSGDGADFERLQIEFPVDSVRALLVTHCHIDHVGRIPYLLAAGFAGPIYCSEATALLLPQVMEDALKIGFTRDERLVRQFLSLMRERIQPVAYGQWVPVPLKGSQASLKVKFKPAGHILGSAYIECEVAQGRQKRRVVFSGDLGAPYSPLLAAPKSPYRCDTLVIESTYGDRLHEDRRRRQLRLQGIVESCLQNSGVVLIPAFSIGRTQELLYEFEQLIHRNRNAMIRQGLPWQDLEIIVDSPLANDFTELYRQLKRYWDKEARKKLHAGRHPLSFEQLTTIDSHDAHIRTVEYLAKTHRPCIVLAASGMCSGGRIVNYLKALLGDVRTDVVFVGYQARGTPGRDIQTYGPRGGYVMLDGKRYDIQARVHTLSGYSAHADKKDLLRFVKRMRVKPREIRIVHGDDSAKRALQAAFARLLPDVRVIVPE